MSKARTKRYKLLEIDKLQDTLKLLTISRPLGRVLIQGYPIWTDTDRYESLYIHGCKCAKCGSSTNASHPVWVCMDCNRKYNFVINAGTNHIDNNLVIVVS